MAGEPLSAPTGVDEIDRAVEHARAHLERVGYQLLEHHHDRRTGARLLILRSDRPHELVACELRIERLGDPEVVAGRLRRRRLRRAALAWLAANRTVDARSLRFDRLSVFVAHDGTPVGLEYEPQAF